MIRFLTVCLSFFTSFYAYGDTQIEIGKQAVRAGDWVEIPIKLETKDKIIGVQFDVFVPLDEIATIDTKKCFSETFAKYSFAGCGQQKAPNADVIRYFLISDDFSPLPSGELTKLRLQVKQSAYSGRYPITIAEKTLQAFDVSSDEYTVKSQAGLLVINGQSASRRPAVKPNTLFENGKFSSASRRPTSLSSHTIVENWETVAKNPKTLHVNLPDGEKLVFHRKTFKPKKGFVPRIGSDEELPNPNIKPEERQFFWYGKAKGAEMGLTIHNGVGGGFITTADASYSINGSFSKTKIEEIDRNKQKEQLCLSVPQKKRFANYVKPLQSKLNFDNSSFTSRSSANHTIRVLVMYTNQARNDSGGQAGIDLLVQQSMNQLNQAVDNSMIDNVNFELAETALLPGFYSTITAPDDYDGYRNILSSLRVNSFVNSLRNSVKADLVVTMIRNSAGTNGSVPLPACGLAFLQMENCSDDFPNTAEYCSVGNAHNAFAYAAVSVDCAISNIRHSFAHEVGHLLGLQHQRSAVPSSVWERAITPYSFAYGVSYGAQPFHTLMWSSFGSEPHYLNFSSPNVKINGQFSGITNSADNARALLFSAPTVERYREAFNARIFEDSFE